jgi:hypothetical protein
MTTVETGDLVVAAAEPPQQVVRQHVGTTSIISREQVEQGARFPSLAQVLFMAAAVVAVDTATRAVAWIPVQVVLAVVVLAVVALDHQVLTVAVVAVAELVSRPLRVCRSLVVAVVMVLSFFVTPTALSPKLQVTVRQVRGTVQHLWIRKCALLMR